MVPVLVEFHGVHVRYDVVVCDALTLEIEEGRGAAKNGGLYVMNGRAVP